MASGVSDHSKSEYSASDHSDITLWIQFLEKDDKMDEVSGILLLLSRSTLTGYRWKSRMNVSLAL